MQEVSPKEAQRRLQHGALLIDVREANEYEEVHAEGAQLMALSEFETRYAELPKDKELVLICRSGARSGRATQFLLDHGYNKAVNLTGGTIAWQDTGLPTQTGAV
ncbi:MULTISPECIES: rhodanese-like domain-containing protein [Deinococcus]|nr:MULTISPECIES: rhodanese-like domain-containing protein [Deinococcus]